MKQTGTLSFLAIAAAVVVAAGAPGGAAGSNLPAQCVISAPAYSGANGPPESTPTARFSYAPAQPAAGSATTFDASRSFDADGDTIVAYYWKFGDGATATTQSPKIQHVFATAGTYKVQLGVTDCRDAGGSASATITVPSSVICRSHRVVTLHLPHGRGIKLLSVTVSSNGKSRRSVHGTALKRPSLRLSFFGYPKGTVTVTLRERIRGRAVTRRHTYHPCQPRR